VAPKIWPPGGVLLIISISFADDLVTEEYEPEYPSDTGEIQSGSSY
jgi:hypothetical protein